MEAIMKPRKWKASNLYSETGEQCIVLQRENAAGGIDYMEGMHFDSNIEAKDYADELNKAEAEEYANAVQMHRIRGLDELARKTLVTELFEKIVRIATKEEIYMEFIDELNVVRICDGPAGAFLIDEVNVNLDSTLGLMRDVMKALYRRFD